jgi:uncharacterized protein (DUF2336 family)
MLQAQESLMADLEAAMKDGVSSNRVNTLRRVTDLFLTDANRLNEEQVKVFDKVLCVLTSRIESRALAELSKRLAPVDNAPIETIRRLARDEEIFVAGPVLAESKRLTAGDLTVIAQTKGQAHLMAISGRAHLEEAVTDVLLDRGNREVVVKLAHNAGARFSLAGYDTLVSKAESDDGLAEAVGSRLDIPKRLLRELLHRATEAVRAKILSLVPAQLRQEVQEMISAIANAVGGSAESDESKAERLVLEMEKEGSLNEAALLDFINNGKHTEAAAALARLCAAPLKLVSSLLAGLRNDALLVPCKAANLTWPTVETILRRRPTGRNISEKLVELAHHDYLKLSIPTAQRTLRFMQVRDKVK